MNQHLTQRTTLSILIAAACLTAFGLTPAQTAHAQGTVATLPAELEGAFFPQPSDINDAVNEYIIPLKGHAASRACSASEKLRRVRLGV
jgi:hypothetical protein